MRSEVIWAAWSEVGLLAHQVVVWKKTRSVLTYSWFMWDYEPVMVGWPAGPPAQARPPADERAVWEIASTIEDGASGIHATQKPVELVRRPDRLAHRARRPALRALRGLGDGPDRRRDDRPALLRHRALPAFCRRDRGTLGAFHRQERRPRGRLMNRASKAELERRIDEVYDLLLSRVTVRAIAGYCRNKWGVSARQVRTYMARARQRMADPCRRDPAREARQGDRRLRHALCQAARGRTLAEARQTLDSIVKLCGLAAPERIELYDFSSYSDKQLAEEVARELPELIHEAERLTRRTPESH